MWSKVNLAHNEIWKWCQQKHWIEYNNMCSLPEHFARRRQWSKSINSDWLNSCLWRSQACFFLCVSIVVFLFWSGASEVNDKVYFACGFKYVCHSVLGVRDCEPILVWSSAHVEMDPTSPQTCLSNSVCSACSYFPECHGYHDIIIFCLPLGWCAVAF